LGPGRLDAEGSTSDAELFASPNQESDRFCRRSLANPDVGVVFRLAEAELANVVSLIRENVAENDSVRQSARRG
jgi:hypothetical protein